MSSDPFSHSAPLQPVRRWWLRLVVFVLIAAIPLFSVRAEWYKRLIFAASMAIWIGSFPVARLRGDRFERGMFIMFLPLRVKSWSLDRFTGILPESEPRDEFAFAWFFFNWWIIWTVLDWMIPWSGGAYKLWLRAGSGKRVLAWQGSNEGQFRANLDLLQRRTSLSIEL